MTGVFSLFFVHLGIFLTCRVSRNRYGAHLNKEQVEELVAPHQESSELVESWLADYGVDSSKISHSSGPWMNIRVPVSTAERMLGATYNVYYSPVSGKTVVRTLRYSLPNVLYDHVDLVTPTTYFGATRKMKATSFLDDLPISLDVANLNGTDPCNVNITPSCLQSLYNINYTPQAADKNSLGVVGYLNQVAIRKDFQVWALHSPYHLVLKVSYIQSFLQQFRPDAAGANFTTFQVNNGSDDQNSTGDNSEVNTLCSSPIEYNH
jgi:tripeptidyl-peptidase-1